MFCYLMGRTLGEHTRNLAIENTKIEDNFFDAKMERLHYEQQKVSDYSENGFEA